MDDNTPATKGDVQAVKGDVRELQTATLRLEIAMSRGFQRIHEDIDRILTMLIGRDTTLTDHGKRIKHLEKIVL